MTRAPTPTEAEAAASRRSRRRTRRTRSAEAALVVMRVRAEQAEAVVRAVNEATASEACPLCWGTGNPSVNGGHEAHCQLFAVVMQEAPPVIRKVPIGDEGGRDG